MAELIFFIAIIILCLLFIIKTFEPHIDIIQKEPKYYKVILWYNFFEGGEIIRKWIKLYERKNKA